MTIQSSQLENVDTGVYWLLAGSRTIVASGADGRLVAISLDDGAIRWQLATGGRVAIDGSADHPSIVVTDGAEIRIYKLPQYARLPEPAEDPQVGRLTP
jgi:hypothetical protein